MSAPIHYIMKGEDIVRAISNNGQANAIEQALVYTRETVRFISAVDVRKFEEI